MFEEIIFQKLWIILPLWLVLYFSDYYLTILGAHYYKAGGCEHLIFEGSYELTPQFQPDIDALSMFSPKFMRGIIISTIVIVVLWFFSRNEKDFLLPYRFICGGLVLLEVAILFRHFQSIVTFWFALKHRGISGQIRYEKWLSYRLSAVELFSFATVFLIVCLFTGSVSFFGGSCFTACTGLNHLKMSKKAAREKSAGTVAQEKK
ncbi:MAG: hypothetical protein WCE45_07380 [Sedimentisphaerales bacterium]